MCLILFCKNLECIHNIANPPFDVGVETDLRLRIVHINSLDCILVILFPTDIFPYIQKIEKTRSILGFDFPISELLAEIAQLKNYSSKIHPQPSPYKTVIKSRKLAERFPKIK